MLKMFVHYIVTAILSYVSWLASIIKFRKSNGKVQATKIPISVNYHFTRKCNYSCGFCFHTAKTSYLAPLRDVKTALRKLADLGMKKINMAGGEPFLYPGHLGEICKYCKEVLKLESVSIVTNGSKVRKQFFRKYGQYVDILAVSVDSFDEEINVKIGRGISISFSFLIEQKKTIFFSFRKSYRQRRAPQTTGFCFEMVPFVGHKIQNQHRRQSLQPFGGFVAKHCTARSVPLEMLSGVTSRYGKRWRNGDTRLFGISNQRRRVCRFLCKTSTSPLFRTGVERTDEKLVHHTG